MTKPRFFYKIFTTCKFFENEEQILWASCCPRKGCATRRSSGIRSESPEISAARPAHNTRFETRADTSIMIGRRMSACCGRCCLTQIAVISDDSILRRGHRLWAARKNTKFHKVISPNCRSNSGRRSDPVSP